MDKNRDKIIMPKISIILPTYNGGRYIKRAIDSVLNQTFKEWELLVVDDGSVDNTKEIVEHFNNSKIIYLKNEYNLGIQKTLNRGLKEANGEYIARIDDDDEWIDSKKLEKQVNFLNENKDYVLIGTGVVVVGEDGKELFRYLLPEKDENIRKKILSKNCFVHSSVMFRKDVALLFGGYDKSENTRHVEDYDLWLKLGKKGKFYNMREYSLNFTMRDGSISSVNKRRQFRKNISLIKNYKKDYEQYWFSLIVRIFIICFYDIFKLIPKRLRNFIINIYKSI